MSHINFNNVSYAYEESKTYAIKDISLQVKRGECLAILGENGSGKTTLIKHINGLLKPLNGSIKIDDEDISKKTIAELAHKVGYVFQNPDHMIFADTVVEEVSFGPKNLGMKEEYIEEKVDEVLKFTRLEQYKESHPMALSGGEKQRLALSSIIVSDPEILILDEPTTGLDYNSIKSMISLIKSLNDRGKTIILITHDMSLVVKVAKRIILMKDGSIIRDGLAKDVFSDQESLARTFLEQPYALKLSLLWEKGINLTPEELIEKIGGKGE